MKIGIYQNMKEVKEALMRYAVANDIYTHDIDMQILVKDDALIVDIKEKADE